MTDESEYFHIRNSGFSRETLSIGFSDIDGEENGGEFAVKVVTVITDTIGKVLLISSESDFMRDVYLVSNKACL